jgi:hypothetical protein
MKIAASLLNGGTHSLTEDGVEGAGVSIVMLG